MKYTAKISARQAAIALVIIPLTVAFAVPACAGFFEDVGKGVGGVLKDAGRGIDRGASTVGRGIAKGAEGYLNGVSAPWRKGPFGAEEPKRHVRYIDRDGREKVNVQGLPTGSLKMDPWDVAGACARLGKTLTKNSDGIGMSCQ